MDFIRTLLLETKKEEFIAQQMGQKIMAVAQRDRINPKPADAFQVVQMLAQYDPTPNQASLQWLARMYAGRQFRMEDGFRIKQDIQEFIKHRATIQNKDLNSYKTVDDLRAVLAPLAGELQFKSNKEKEKFEKLEGAQWVFNAPGFKIIHLETEKSAKLFGEATHWCTTSGAFESYAYDGKIFVIMAKDPSGSCKTGDPKCDVDDWRRFQLHYESGQMMDATDKPVDKKEVELLSSYPQWGEFLNNLINQHYTFLDHD